MRANGRRAAWLAVAGLACLAGCEPVEVHTPAEGVHVERKQAPSPLNLLLPEAIRIHPFTGTRTFDQQGGISGIEVRTEATDAYGDATKAFGHWRFELYEHRAFASEAKGKKIAVWEADMMDPKTNRMHWDSITRTYAFRLKWDLAIPVGHKFVMVAIFSSDYTKRLFTERTFVAGQ